MPICPNKNCGSTKSKILDTIDIKDFIAIRRYRECLDCGTRFATEEKFAYKTTKDNNNYEFCRT